MVALGWLSVSGCQHRYTGPCVQSSVSWSFGVVDSFTSVGSRRRLSDIFMVNAVRWGLLAVSFLDGGCCCCCGCCCLLGCQLTIFSLSFRCSALFASLARVSFVHCTC